MSQEKDDLELQKEVLQSVEQLLEKSDVQVVREDCGGDILFIYREKKKFIFQLDVCSQSTEFYHLVHNKYFSADETDYKANVVNYLSSILEDCSLVKELSKSFSEEMNVMSLLEDLKLKDLKFVVAINIVMNVCHLSMNDAEVYFKQSEHWKDSFSWYELLKFRLIGK